MSYQWAFSESSVYLDAYDKYFYGRDRRIRKDKSVLFNSDHIIGVKTKLYLCDTSGYIVIVFFINYYLFFYCRL